MYKLSVDALRASYHRYLRSTAMTEQGSNNPGAALDSFLDELIKFTSTFSPDSSNALSVPPDLKNKIIGAKNDWDLVKTRLAIALESPHAAKTTYGFTNDTPEKFFKEIFSSVPDGVSILDKNLCIVLVNKQMERWYADSLPIVGKKCFEVYHGRTEPCRACPSVAAMHTGKTAFEVVPRHRKDGTVEGWQDLYSFPVLDAATGEVKGVIEHVRDCTDRRAIEEKLRQNEALFRTLADTAGVGIFIVKNGKFAYVNSYIANGTGYSRDELLAMSFWEIVHPDFQATVQDRYRTRMRGLPANAEYDFKYIKKGGEVGWANHSVGLLEFEGGPAVIGTLQEITLRKKAEEALAAEKEFLSVTVESIGDGVVSVDLSGVIVTINKNALALVHDKEDCGLGKNIDDVLFLVDETTRDRHVGALKSVLQACRKEPVERLVTIQTLRHGPRLVELFASPLCEHGEQFGAVLVFHDITEKQRMEGELFRAKKLESLGILAGGIAHDFNNILTGIITHLFMAKVNLQSDSETYQLLVEAEKSSFKASNLIKQLLAFSKGSASIMETVSISALVEDAVGFCMSGSNVNYRLDIEPDLPLVEADKGQIDQVLNNLVINADQSMPCGGAIVVTVKRHTAPSREPCKDEKLSALPNGNYVVVAVADEGVGIPQENLEKIFDPYFTTKPQGNGLGLAIVYSIVKRHKGIVTVESTPGKGSIFSVYLPAALSEPAPKSKESNVTETAALPKLNVLVMDDDNSVRTVIAQLLKNSGCSTHCVSTGEEAVLVYENAVRSAITFDVVVLDLTIPGAMGGREAAERILKLDPGAKMLLSSGYTNDPIFTNFKDYGFLGVIPKPFNIAEFLNVLRSVTNSAKKQQ